MDQESYDGGREWGMRFAVLCYGTRGHGCESLHPDCLQRLAGVRDGGQVDAILAPAQDDEPTPALRLMARIYPDVPGPRGDASYLWAIATDAEPGVVDADNDPDFARGFIDGALAIRDEAEGA